MPVLEMYYAALDSFVLDSRRIYVLLMSSWLSLSLSLSLSLTPASVSVSFSLSLSLFLSVSLSLRQYTCLCLFLSLTLWLCLCLSLSLSFSLPVSLYLPSPFFLSHITTYVLNMIFKSANNKDSLSWHSNIWSLQHFFLSSDSCY